MTHLSLELASALAQAALARASELELKPLAITILDAGGHLICCLRQDGASHGRIQIAWGKAAGALFLGMSSRAIAEIAQERPSFVGALTGICPTGVVPAAGGLIIFGAGGRPIGAIGISGDTSDNDELCAAAAISLVCP